MPESAAQYKSIAHLTHADTRMPVDRFAFHFTKINLSNPDFQDLHKRMEYVGWQHVAEDCRTQLDLDETANLLIAIFRAAESGNEWALAIRPLLWTQINAQPKEWVRKVGDRMTAIAGDPRSDSNSQANDRSLQSEAAQQGDRSSPAQPVTGSVNRASTEPTSTLTYESVCEAWQEGRDDAGTLFRYFYGELTWIAIGEALEQAGQEQVFAFMFRVWHWMDDPEQGGKEKSFKQSVFNSIWANLPKGWSLIFQRTLVNPELDRRKRAMLAAAEEAKRLRDEAELAEWQETEAIKARIFDKSDRSSGMRRQESAHLLEQAQESLNAVQRSSFTSSTQTPETRSGQEDSKNLNAVQRSSSASFVEIAETGAGRGSEKNLNAVQRSSPGHGGTRANAGGRNAGKNRKWLHTPTVSHRSPEFMLDEIVNLEIELDLGDVDAGLAATNALYERVHQEELAAGWDDAIAVRKSRWNIMRTQILQLSDALRQRDTEINAKEEELAEARRYIQSLEANHEDEMWTATKAAGGDRGSDSDDDDGYQGYGGYNGYNGYDPTGSGGAEASIEDDYYAPH